MSTSSDNPEYMAGMQYDEPSATPATMIDAFEQCIAEYRAVLAGMTCDQAAARPVPGKWSTIELMAHVADAEVYFTDRIERTIALDKPLLLGVDERNYPERLHYQSLDLNEQLDLFTALRRHVVRILRLQPSKAWTRTAVHSDTGLVTLRQLVQQATRHARHHLPFIAEKRRALNNQ